MIRLSLILIVSLALTILTSFNSGHKSPLRDKVPGRYYKYFTSGIDGGTDYYLTIKKDSYIEIEKTNMLGKKSKMKIIGHWPIKGDTIYLVPTKVITSKKTFDCTDKKIDGGLICKTDTLVYKDNALWSIRPSYKEYTRR